MRRSIVVVLTGALVAGALLVPAEALPRATKRTPLRCTKVTRAAKAFRFCTGSVTSRDKTVRLDADLTLPARGDGPFPLVVLLHGLGGSKESYESSTIEGSGGTYHFNNLWFASRGYAVLNHTARGYGGSSCLDAGVESIDGDLDLYEASPACRPQVVHQRYDMGDTQHLISGLVDEDLLNIDVSIAPKKVGIAGVSLGGGQTWLLTRRNTWKTPEGSRVKLAAAVPIIGWTDLMDALVPNGRARDSLIQTTAIEERMAERFGVPKSSYIEALYTLAQISSADFRLPGYLDAWRARLGAGEPYDDPIALDALRKVLQHRSAYYLGKRGSLFTPTLAIQGFTDHLFTAVQPLRMYNRYASEAGFRFSAYFGDWGHPISQNKATETAFIMARVNAWLDRFLKGKGTDPTGRFEARITECGADVEGDLYRAATWEGLQSGDSAFPLTLEGDLSTEVNDPHATALNPAVTSNANTCRTTDTTVAEGNLAAEVELPGGFTMLGMPEIAFEVDPSLANLYVAVRLWDVDPATDTQTLVDRGVFRLGDDLAATAAFQLFGNGWSFEPGHTMKVELTADDSPTFEDPSGVGTIAVSSASITLPEANEAARVAP